MVVHCQAPTGALVLARRVGQAIIIDTSDGLIEVSLVEARDGKGRIRVEAPRQVKIDREEVYDAKRAALREPAEAATA